MVFTTRSGRDPNMCDNKRVVRDFYDSLAALPSSNSAIADLLHADCVWKIPGLGTHDGKEAIMDELIVPFGRGMSNVGIMELTNVIAEGDFVVAEGFARNRVTHSGVGYNNTYCTIFEIREGKIHSVSEYCDTALVRDVFGSARGT